MDYMFYYVFLGLAVGDGSGPGSQTYLTNQGESSHCPHADNLADTIMILLANQYSSQSLKLQAL